MNAPLYVLCMVLLYFVVGLITTAIAIKIDGSYASTRDIEVGMVVCFTFFWPILLIVVLLAIVYKIFFLKFLLQFILRIPGDSPS